LPLRCISIGNLASLEFFPSSSPLCPPFAVPLPDLRSCLFLPIRRSHRKFLTFASEDSPKHLAVRFSFLPFPLSIYDANFPLAFRIYSERFALLCKVILFSLLSLLPLPGSEALLVFTVMFVLDPQGSCSAFPSFPRNRFPIFHQASQDRQCKPQTSPHRLSVCFSQGQPRGPSTSQPVRFLLFFFAEPSSFFFPQGSYKDTHRVPLFPVQLRIPRTSPSPARLLSSRRTHSSFSPWLHGGLILSVSGLIFHLLFLRLSVLCYFPRGVVVLTPCAHFFPPWPVADSPWLPRANDLSYSSIVLLNFLPRLRNPRFSLSGLRRSFRPMDPFFIVSGLSPKVVPQAWEEAYFSLFLSIIACFPPPPIRAVFLPRSRDLLRDPPQPIFGLIPPDFR